uniref:Uncharacterized protein n=1 Tax=Syphacia muris TaxID=451379 RepID=A0A0N5AI09_9BILA
MAMNITGGIRERVQLIHASDSLSTVLMEGPSISGGGGGSAMPFIPSKVGCILIIYQILADDCWHSN